MVQGRDANCRVAFSNSTTALSGVCWRPCRLKAFSMDTRSALAQCSENTLELRMVLGQRGRPHSPICAEGRPSTLRLAYCRTDTIWNWPEIRRGLGAALKPPYREVGGA